MAYDQLGMSVGGFLQDLGTSMYRDKRAKAAYAEEMKAREAEDQRKYEMQLKQIEAAELSKAEREAAREQARAEREAARDERLFANQKALQEMRGASQEKAASIRANRPVMAKDPAPAYDKAVNRKTGKQRYIKRGEELGSDEEFYVPRGDRRSGRPLMSTMERVGSAMGDAAEAFAQKARQMPAPSAGPKTPAAPQGMKLVGHTPDGKPVYEDQNGQRFVDE